MLGRQSELFQTIPAPLELLNQHPVARLPARVGTHLKIGPVGSDRVNVIVIIT